MDSVSQDKYSEADERDNPEASSAHVQEENIPEDSTSEEEVDNSPAPGHSQQPEITEEDMSGLSMLEGGLCKFELKGDQNELSERWKRWKRSFDIYIRAKSVTNDSQKIALLLHSGGLEVQDLYFTLLGDRSESDLNYEQVDKMLTDHFTPKRNIPYERHLFRKMQQQQNETIDQFVYRLRQKAQYCDFTDVDENIRDQVVEKCSSDIIRRKFLERADTNTLSQLQELARSIEAVEQQMSSMKITGNADTVNAIGKGKSSFSKKASKTSKGEKGKSGKCYRCGESGHYAYDKSCPAKKEKCKKCGLLGHFSKVCHTKQEKYKKDPDSARSINSAEVNSVEYGFQIGNSGDIGDIAVNIGGVDINVLVDSGSTCNLIDSTLWSKMKESGIRCKSERRGKEVFAYGQEEKLNVLGVFLAEIMSKQTRKAEMAEFVVFKGKGVPLLGRDTAEKLNLLRVGPEVVNQISSNENKDIISRYKDIFSGVGQLKGIELKLHIDENVKPVAQPLRRIAYGLREKVEKKLNELLEQDIIEEVKETPSKWISPLVVVNKPDGDIRMCVDMRRANTAIIRERHPIPTVDDVLFDMNGAKVFSKMDLKWGFHQIQLEPSSRDITTFITHKGIYRYKRLMFGITSAPEIYQKIIQDMLRGCKGTANIADDVIIFGRNMKEHDENLFAALDRIRQSGMTLNGKKCQFRMNKLTFFGHDLSGNGVSASEEKIAAIQNAGQPKDVSEVRSFIGLVQYSAKFIPNFASVAELLRKLVRKSECFRWEKEQQEAFQELKDLITSRETLAYFKDSSLTRIVCDAGPGGLGAVLLQQQDQVWRVISYASRCLSDVEKRYSQTEKEALAIVWSCERFALYVQGRCFEIETDHKPLEVIYGKKSKPSARIERWVLRLQGFDYKVVYRPGKTNIADSLSRLKAGNCKDISGEEVDFVRLIVDQNMPAAISARDVEIESEKDPELQAVRRYIVQGNWFECKLPSYSAIKDELTVYGNLVLRGNRIVIPAGLRRKVLNLAHEGHQGITKTRLRLRSKVWWPKMGKDAESICKACHGCQVVGPLSPPEPLRRVLPPTGPWQDLAVDLMGPLPNGEHILVLVDYYSRYYEIAVMKSITSNKVIDAILPMLCRHGIPFSIRSDNGRQFVSEEFEEFLRQYGIEHRKSTPLWPKANGEVEIQNKSLGKTLEIAQVEKKNLKEELMKYLLAYRSTPQITTGESPAKLMFGREIRTKLPELRIDGNISNEESRDREWEKKLQQKEYVDKKLGATEKNIEVGSQVLVRNDKKGKLVPNFEVDPYTVKAKEGNEIVMESKDGAMKRRNSSFVKPFVQDDTNSEVLINESVPEATPSRPRLTRERKLPTKYQDFVVDIPLKK